MFKRIWFELYQSCGNKGVLDVCLCLGCGGVGVAFSRVWEGGV